MRLEPAFVVGGHGAHEDLKKTSYISKEENKNVLGAWDTSTSRAPTSVVSLPCYYSLPGAVIWALSHYYVVLWW